MYTPLTDWPHIKDIIFDIKNREARLPAKLAGEILWECDYSYLTSAILPYYFHRTLHNTWVITPEFNYMEGNHPDYTIFNLTRNPYNRERRVVAPVPCPLSPVPCPLSPQGKGERGKLELKSKTGASWQKLLEQMWEQADVSKNTTSGKLWAIGQKGLEICVFRFDVLNYQNQNPSCYTNFEPLNLHHLSFVHARSEGWIRGKVRN